jgi:mRNA interferase MazF
MGVNRTCPIRRGDIFYADLTPVVGSEQGGLRPVLIIQNDVGNQYSPTIIAAIITGQIKCWHLPTHVVLAAAACGLSKTSVVMLEQIRTLDKGRLQQYVGHVEMEKMPQINTALEISVGLAERGRNRQP